MSGLSNTWKRLGNLAGGKGYKTNKERRTEADAKAQGKLDKVYSDAAGVIPDEEVIKRNERRKAAKRQGSRASTVLTNNDQLG